MTDLKTSSNLSYALPPPDAVQSAIRPRSRRISPLPRGQLLWTRSPGRSVGHKTWRT